MTTLDGQERALVTDDLLICDGERPVALAGVLGGADSEVSPTTTRVLLESASFEARSVRRTARRLALPSEASQRFERGVDPELATLGAARAAVLLARLGGGRIARGAVDVYPRPPARPRVPLRLSRTRALIGADIEPGACEAALMRLGCDVAPDGDGHWTVTPPSARADLTREVDLIEDILRVHGYANVPATLPALHVGPAQLVDDTGDRARRALAGAGLAEAITFGFQSVERCAALGVPAADRRAHPVAVKNPMSAEQAVMRTSLLPNLVAAVARNASFGIGDVALFEVGSVFLRQEGQPLAGEPRELCDEPLHATAVLAGARPRWLGPAQPWDYFDVKGVLEHLARTLGAGGLRFVAAADIPYLHPGIAARVVDEAGREVGEIGEVHPSVRERLGVEVPVFMFDLALHRLPAPRPAQMRAVPRFPASARDVSLLLDEPVAAARVRDVIAGAAEPLVESVRLAEEYRDARLGAGKKSMLWSITYRAADRTLTDAEVDQAHEAIVARLVAETAAERR
jgi:phenylalanyl-tRNA synthetase beta chain